ncbi:alcohol dehydrogenase [Apiospora kogelbergensis]|uniref:Alcohol dehydrogenase n=1 Tax=Apiospora kogelbergensis TaxID=1337665 RepID=A0AAW0REF0_9PEZI
MAAPTLPNPTSVFVLPSGRTLGYAQYGTPSASAPTAFYHHGFPGSQSEALGWDAAARAAGVRLISVERPGMGASTFQVGRTLLDWPGDLLALADHLQVSRFAVLGVSGGGPYALASHHRLPRARCAGAALVCALYPTTALGCGGMLWTTWALLTLCPRAPTLCGFALDYVLGGVARDLARPERLETAVAEGLQGRTAQDRSVLERRDARAALVASTRGAMVSGGLGAAWDGLLLGGDFGFRLEDVRAEDARGGRVVMWHGGLDQNVPAHMAERAAARMAGAELRLSPECAHLDLPYKKADEVMQCVKEMLQS